MSNASLTDLSKKISNLLNESRQRVVQAVNHTMVLTYFEIGRMIVEEEQNGKERADYGSQLLSDLSNSLTQEFGRGFSITNLQQMRMFYNIYSKQQTLSAKSENSESLSENFKLSWSHYLKLMRIDDELERKFYEIETLKNNWSLRELNRQYDSALFTRLAISKDKNEILRLSEQGQVIEKPQDVIKDPYVLEFIGIPEQNYFFRK